MLQRSFCSRVDVGAERHTDRRHGRVLERLRIHRLTREVSVSRESLCGLLVEVLRKKATLCGSYVRKGTLIEVPEALTRYGSGKGVSLDRKSVV